MKAAILTGRCETDDNGKYKVIIRLETPDGRVTELVSDYRLDTVKEAEAQMEAEVRAMTQELSMALKDTELRNGSKLH